MYFLIIRQFCAYIYIWTSALITKHLKCYSLEMTAYDITLLSVFVQDLFLNLGRAFGLHRMAVCFIKVMITCFLRCYPKSSK